MNITLRQMEYLVALAETGQITRAAQRCHVSQSSMTIGLKKMEQNLGVKLFQRHAKGARLTTAGELFARRSQQIFGGIEDAIKEIRRSPDDMKGQIRIGITETISAYLIPVLLASLSEQFPNLNIIMEERDRASIETGLLNGSFDLAFILVSNLKIHDELSYETMLRSPRKLWMHSENPLQYSESLTLSDVANANFILLDMDEHVETVGQYWGKQGLTPKVAFKSSSLEAVRSLVALGQGVTILSDLVYRPFSLEGRRIVNRELDDNLPTMDIGCAWRRRDIPSRIVSAVIDFIRRVISEQKL